MAARPNCPARGRREQAERLEHKARHKLAHLPELTKDASGAELERKRAVIDAANAEDPVSVVVGDFKALAFDRALVLKPVIAEAAKPVKAVG